jgi:Starch-binding associating with outer membrane/Susd and RagB outer membrane lipoprotein
MNFINKLSKVSAALALVLLVGSCTMFDLDINKDPNNPTVAAPDLLLPNIQTSLMNDFAGVEGDLETYVGLIGTQGLSRWDLQATQYDGLWQSLYRTELKDLDQLIVAATASNSPHYLGISQVLKAYAYATMVDLFGDVPFSEASQADAEKAVKAPKFDKDADIYAACLKLLDDGIVNLAKTSPVVVSGDLIYGGNAPRWSRLAKTLKLKFLMTGRKGITGADAQIKTLLTDGGFISGAADDFKFTFSKDPTSVRHPWYTGAYTGTAFDYSYICHQLILDMHLDLDPRTRFYFRSQTILRLNPNDVTQRNTANPGYIPWTPAYDSLRARGWDSTYINGLFARDRGDASGIPADEQLRLLPGVYPCGGYYNTNLTAGTRPVANAAAGGGIFPALTDVNVSYYRIEAILALGATGDAKVEFDKAIRAHITRVVDFGRATDGNSVAPTAAAVDAYVAKWMARYDAAANAEAKLNVVMKQLWYSSWGNGFEIYNAYRRTGYPNTINDLINVSPKGATSFIWRMPYPNSEINLNASITADQKGYKYWVNKIFWNK